MKAQHLVAAFFVRISSLGAWRGLGRQQEGEWRKARPLDKGTAQDKNVVMMTMIMAMTTRQSTLESIAG